MISRIQITKKLLVILGSTSTGKTDLALKLAKIFNGELISCDSRQVYIGLDIGTGKLPTDLKFKNDLRIKKSNCYWEMNEIKIWMYDVISAKKQYTVADYVKDAGEKIKDIQNRKKLPIIVGGTGLYLKALLYGLSNLSIPTDEKLRKELEELNVKRLQDRLKKISIKRWKKMNYSDQQNPRRLIRAIELEVSSKDNTGQRAKGLLERCNVIKIGLSATKAVLYQRSDQRVVKRINQGMIEEAQDLNRVRLSLKRMKQLGLEYGVLADYLEGKIVSKEELIKILQNKIHSYIRRQITWFKKEKNVIWFDITSKNYLSKIEKLVGTWYDSS